MSQFLDMIGTLCSDIENNVLIYNDYPSKNMMTASFELMQMVRMGMNEHKKAVEQYLHDMLNRTGAKRYARVWIYSIMLAINPNPIAMKELLEYIICENTFGINIKYYLYYQTIHDSFLYPEMNNENIEYLRWKLFNQIVNGFKNNLKELLQPIPAEERDENMVLVSTLQFLGSGHAPTKRCLDRCKMLLEMDKKVLLINTAEALSLVGEIPYYAAAEPSYCKEFLEMEEIIWEGVKIPFFQCEQNMPTVEGIRLLLQTVRNIKPGLIISIGGSSVLAELMNELIPVLTIGLSASNMEITMTDCQTLSRELRDSDLQLLQEFGLGKNNIIRSVSIFSMPEQSENVSRKELGLPDDKFIIAIAGGRLADEMDKQFIEMLCKAVDDEMAIALIGGIHNKDIIPEVNISQVPELKDKVYDLGRTDCLPAWLKVCDLYVNPHRRGGGTMGVMALAQGKPVVTTSYGDAAVNVGKEFWTESYDTMPDLIRQYKNDADYYNLMSEKAKARADFLVDADNEFRRVLAEFKRRTIGS